jgi:hypothetical protein
LASIFRFYGFRHSAVNSRCGVFLHELSPVSWTPRRCFVKPEGDREFEVEAGRLVRERGGGSREIRVEAAR